MIKRSVVLGGLIAGAFLLPNLATAGVVSGPCVNCHTMHNSQNGATVSGLAPNGQLLMKAGGCIGCHAGAGGNLIGTGMSAAGPGLIAAPQVDDTTNTLSGGFFTGAVDANHHNPTEFVDPDGDLAGVPGTGGARATLIVGDPAAGLQCKDCHDSSGGHHGAGAADYRMLGGVTGNTEAALYGVQGGGIGNRSAATYNATTMNAFCGSCHGAFHTQPNQESATAGTWLRHPTDVTVTYNAATRPSIVTLANNAAAPDQTPVGEAGTDTNMVMCISCHLPHGGANADLLAFAYDAATNIAGGTATGDRSVGCETCHSYNGFGM